MEDQGQNQTNTCSIIEESTSSRALLAVSDTLALMPGSENLRNLLNDVAWRTRIDAHNAAQVPHLENQIRTLQGEIKDLRQADAEELVMLKVVIEEMRKRGGSVNGVTNFRQSMRDLLNHLTVIDGDIVKYDETNKLAQRIE